MKTEKKIDVIEGNRLIAEFMGSIKNDGSYLQYHTSWNFIMPVVDEIRKNYDMSIQLMDGDCNIFCNKQTLHNDEIFSIGGYSEMIDGVYWGVIAFINWYNANKS